VTVLGRADTDRLMSFLPYAHLLAALLYVGGMVCVAGLLIPVARRLPEGQRAIRAVVQLIAILHPVLLASLGVLIVTGAAMLTDLKVALGSRYFSQVFTTLGPKLLVVFILALLNAYQFFGLGLRLSRSTATDGERSVATTDGQTAVINATVGKLQWCAWVGAALGGVAVYLGLAMGHGW
jgi:uncharacterized membrane protein